MRAWVPVHPVTNGSGTGHGQVGELSCSFKDERNRLNYCEPPTAKTVQLLVSGHFTFAFGKARPKPLETVGIPP